MASSTKLQAEPEECQFTSVCPACGGQGRILYPFPGDSSDRPLGGVKIKGVTCLECEGTGQHSIVIPVVAERA